MIYRDEDRASQAANARRRQGFSGPPPAPVIYAPGVHNLADVEIASSNHRYEASRTRQDGSTRESSLPPSGPKPPPSWKVKLPADSERAQHSAPPDTVEWRRQALQLVSDMSVLADREAQRPPGGSSNVMSLQTMCLRTIVVHDLPSRWPTSFLSSLPAHIRQRIAFEAGVWNPLSSRTLTAIYGSRDVHRIVVIGKPAATHALPLLPGKGDRVVPVRGVGAESIDGLLRTLLERYQFTSTDGGDDEDSWDVTADDSSLSQSNSKLTPEPSAILATSLALMHVALGEGIPSLLPHTLTRLSLIAVPLSAMALPTERHVPLRLLSRTLPRLTHLDLSFNTLDEERLINIAWDTQWRDMKIVGLRSCTWWSGMFKATIESEMIGQRINARRPGRWIQFLVD